MISKAAPSTGALDWLVKQARLVVYIKDIKLIALEEWWSAITGAHPADINRQPMNHIYKVVGEVNTNTFIINQAGNKIDFILQNAEIGATGPEPMGGYENAIVSLNGLVKKWTKLTGLPEITRLALGCNLLVEIGGVDEGYALLKGHLPNLKLDAKKSKDFTYQINRPRPTKTSIRPLKINLLSKWSITEHQVVSFVAASDGLNVASKSYQYVCQLDLDINTSIHYDKIIPKSKIQELFMEFSRMGGEIEKKGDLM